MAVPVVLGGLAMAYGLMALQNVETASDGARAPESSRGDIAVPAKTGTSVVFPLVAKPGDRYLVDAAGTPFLIHGEAAWGLMTQLTPKEVDGYLTDRRARGFNTILVMLIQASFGTNAPANADGELPFLLPGDYGAPNEAYFAHADWVLRRAADEGFLVLLTPSYLGPEGDSAGWYHAMVANGPDQLRQYGKFLGRRYRDFTNILWVHGGDYNPSRKELVTAIAEGIREEDPRALHTAHGSRGTAALDFWQGEPWLQVNSIYSSLPKHWSRVPVYAAALEQYARPEGMPFFLLEGVYENEHQTSERHLRMQAYQSVLCGAAGQIFGNNPVWNFDGFSSESFFAADDWFAPPSVTWQQALGSRGAQSMTHLYDLLMSIPWWRLEPDADNALLLGGLGSEQERAVAALTTDRSLAILYLPGSREITVDLERFVGSELAALWYDPADGRFSRVRGSPFPASGLRRFRPEPGPNSSGFDDWVLVLRSDAAESTLGRTQWHMQPRG
jgi:Protein of unknown function (DUF4038)/Putative collagen-binding domain of a collagenase